MRPVWLPGLIAVTFLFAGNALAQDTTPSTHYKWHDAQGGLHYSDTVPAAAARFGYDVLDNDGIVVRHVEREKTPEERRAAATQAARVAKAKQQADQQALADRQLLSAYPTEAELKEAQQAQLAHLQQGILATQTNLRSQEQSLADLLAHAAELERSGDPVPAELRTRVATQRQTVTDERNQVDKLRHDRDAVTQNFADELQRYRVMRAKMQSDMSGG